MSGLRKHKFWPDVLNDPELKKNLWGRYHLIKQLWYDLQSLRKRETRLMEGIANYLWARQGWKDPLYSPPDLGEKDFLLDWLAVNRSVVVEFPRPIKTRQLFIYGEPSKEKNLPIILMGKELPYLFQKRGPWAERIIPLQFRSHLHKIVEERLILTLWSRIEIRAGFFDAQGWLPIHNNFLQVNEFYLEKNIITTPSAPDLNVYGLCQILLGDEPSFHIAIRKKDEIEK